MQTLLTQMAAALLTLRLARHLRCLHPADAALHKDGGTVELLPLCVKQKGATGCVCNGPERDCQGSSHGHMYPRGKMSPPIRHSSACAASLPGCYTGTGCKPGNKKNKNDDVSKHKTGRGGPYEKGTSFNTPNGSWPYGQSTLEQ